jgi:hypothetical protein
MNEGWKKLIEWWKSRLVPMTIILLGLLLIVFALSYFRVVPSDFFDAALGVSVGIAVGIFLYSFLYSFIDYDKVSDKVSKMGKWKARLIFVAILFGYGLGVFALALLLAYFFRVEPFVLYTLCIMMGIPSTDLLFRAFKIDKKFLLGLTLFVLFILILFVLFLNVFFRS